MFDIIETPSPFFNERAKEIKSIIIHCLGYITIETCLSSLIRAEVSAHYFVPQMDMSTLQTQAHTLWRLRPKSNQMWSMTWQRILENILDIKPRFPKTAPVFQLVHEQKRAWHAGISHWGSQRNLNDLTIGIEFHSPEYAAQGDFYAFSRYTSAQIATGIHLIKDLMTRYALNPLHLLAHSDIAWDRQPMPKTDPGPFFFWEELYKKGLGYLPLPREKVPSFTQEKDKILYMQESFYKIGYTGCPLSGNLCVRTQRVMDAYRMHFLTAEEALIKQPEITSFLLRTLATHRDTPFKF